MDSPNLEPPPELSELTCSSPDLEAKSRGKLNEAYLEKFLTIFCLGIVIPSILEWFESIGTTCRGNGAHLHVFLACLRILKPRATRREGHA